VFSVCMFSFHTFMQDTDRLCSIVQISLQKYMRCKSGCFHSLGSDQPAEVVVEAPTSLVRILFGFTIF